MQKICSDKMEKIRKAKLSDAQGILRLYNQDKNLWGNNKTGYDLKDVKSYMAKKPDFFIICEIDNKVIAFIFVEVWQAYFNLHTMIVDKNFRKRGIGTKLIAHLENKANTKGIRIIELITEEKNYAMQKFIKKEGYSKGKKFIFYSKNIK